jgi:hypothetical protein
MLSANIFCWFLFLGIKNQFWPILENIRQHLKGLGHIVIGFGIWPKPIRSTVLVVQKALIYPVFFFKVYLACLLYRILWKTVHLIGVAYGCNLFLFGLFLRFLLCLWFLAAVMVMVSDVGLLLFVLLGVCRQLNMKFERFETSSPTKYSCSFSHLIFSEVDSDFTSVGSFQVPSNSLFCIFCSLMPYPAFFSFIIVLDGVHCGIYKTSYNISNIS